MTTQGFSLRSVCAAELLGTFALVFFSTGASIVDQQTGALTHVGASAVVGLAVTALIYAFGDVSGAHLNPAVTLGFWLSKRFKGKLVPAYILSQLAGALAASALCKLIFPDVLVLGTTTPSGSWQQSFLLETVLTFLMMLVILRVSTGAKEKGITAGLAVGAIVGLEVMIAGPVSGGSMNPVRSLAPALFSQQLEPVWLYLTAPFLGAGLAVAVHHFFFSAPQDLDS